MKLSLITPTEAREAHLKILYESLLQQDYSGEWEWLIYDTYYCPSDFFKNLKDSRVHYCFSKEILTIGEKRNRLIEASKGQAIIHVDDDDYYAPTYLTTLSKKLSRCDFFHYHSWFCYDLFCKQLYYVSSEKKEENVYWLHPIAAGDPKEVILEGEKSDVKNFLEKIKWGYGFCYAYRKEIFKKCQFRDISYGEDIAFFKEIKEKNYRISLSPEKSGEVLHIMHDKNTSGVFPQYRLPSFFLNHFFPKISYYLDNYPN